MLSRQGMRRSTQGEKLKIAYLNMALRDMISLALAQCDQTPVLPFQGCCLAAYIF
jgi:hypothetical protein